MGLQEMKKLQPQQRICNQIEEAGHGMGENFSQLYIRQRIDNQNVHGAQKLSSPKINDSMKKWANELNRAFSRIFKEEVQMAKKKKKNPKQNT
jgi:hypothetical protein